MQENDNIFDSEIKSILESGREEVPGHVWDAIAGRLSDAAQIRRKRRAVIWRNTAVAVAAAAGLAVAVVFNGILPGGDYGKMRKDAIAVIPGGPIKSGTSLQIDERLALAAPVELPSPGRIPATAASCSRTDLNAAQDEGNAPQDEAAVQTATQETVAPSAVPQKGTQGKISETVEDDFSDFFADEQKPRRKIKASLAVFGNAVSNQNSNNSSASGVKPLYKPDANAPTKTTISETGESTYGIPLSFGIGTKIMFTPRWSFGIGINYTHLSRTFSGNYIHVSETGDISTTGFSKISNRLDYIGIPVNVYYSILSNKFVDFYAYAGGAAEKCISDKYLMTRESNRIEHSEKVSGMQLSANAGIGVEFIIFDRLGIYIDPELTYYFQNNQPKSIRTIYRHNLMLGFEAGLRIRL